MAGEIIINGMRARPAEGIFQNNQTGGLHRLHYIECQFGGKFLPLCENGSPKLFRTAQERDRAMTNMAQKYAVNPCNPVRIKGA